MREFTLIIECYNYYKDYSELFDYLYSLNGVLDVVITTDDLLTINVKYDEKLINDDRIKLEILAFLNALNYPVIYGFDRHIKETKLIKLNYKICCEFCFGNIIYTLIDTKGIEKVESNFYQKYWKKLDGDDYFINIYYNPKVISKENINKLIKEIDVYG